MTSGSGDSRSVSLVIPAQADYLGLARLALGAVCGQTDLAPDGVADLKLALTETSGAFVSDLPATAPGAIGRLAFEFALEPGRVVIEIAGATLRRPSTEERDLSRAIIEATVDEWSPSDGHVRLVKYLDSPGE